MSRNTALTIVIFAGLAFSFSASSETRVPPDYSLTLDQYVDIGMPQSGADWSADQRSTALSILRRLADEDPTQLPRFKSERSGALFEKLAHEEVFRRHALEGRMGGMTGSELEHLDANEMARLAYRDSLEAIYAPQSTGGLLFDRELVEIYEQQLTRVLQLRAERDADQAKFDSGVSSSEGGDNLATMHKELLKALDRLLLLYASKLADFSIAQDFTAEARADATSHLLQQVPQIAPLLSEESRTTLHEVLRKSSVERGADSRLKALSNAPW